MAKKLYAVEDEQGLVGVFKASSLKAVQEYIMSDWGLDPDEDTLDDDVEIYDIEATETEVTEVD